MDKLKDSILRVANSDPNNPLSSSQISFLRHQIQLAFPVFHTPTHPTYAAMIQDAIKGLNEEGGSNEEAISVFIKENYAGLPWAHSMYLTHHLSKLSENGDIVWNSTSKCYTLSEWAGTEDGHSRKKPRKQRLERKTKEGANEDKYIEEVGRNEDEVGKLSGENAVEGSGNFNGYEEEDTEGIAGSRTKPIRRSLVFVEESDEVGRTAVDEVEQILVADRLNEGLARGDGGGDTANAIKSMLVPNECAEESHVTSFTPLVSDVKDDKNPELTVKALPLRAGDIPVQVKIQEGNSKQKQPNRKPGRKRKAVVNEDEEGNLGEEEVLEVSGNLTGFQAEGIDKFGKSMSRTKSQRFVVCENNDEVRETAIDGRKQNLASERLNEVLAQGDEDDDIIEPAKMMLVPAECVEDSPVTVIRPSVSNIMGDIDSKLAGKASGLKESELMIVPYERNTSMVNAELNSLLDEQGRVLVCALPCISELKRLECKNSAKKRLKACKKAEKNVSLELIPSSSASVGFPNVLELDQKSSAHKSSPKKRLRSGRGKVEVSLETVDHNLRECNQLQELLSKASGMESEMGPAWLVPMLNGRYFIPCPIHEGSARKGCTMFCLDCIGDAFCFKCLPHHKDHRVLQVRISSNYYSVHVDDIQRHLDISSIQTYTNNSAKIVYFNCRSYLKLGKGSTCCENCHRGISDSVRFCSLRCKLCIALSGSTNFKELPVDQIHQACPSSLLEDASIEPLETQKNLDPSCLSSLEDPMSVVEEDLPLKKVFEKCTKRKKQAEPKLAAEPLAIEASSLLCSKSQVDQPTSENFKQQIEDQERKGQNDVGQLGLDDIDPASVEDILTVVAPLAIEAPSLLGLKSQVDQPISESKQQIEDEERQSKDGVGLDDVEVPKDTSVEGNVLTSYGKCEPEPKQTQVDQPISENAKQQIKDEERQNDVRIDDVEEPMDTSVQGNVITIFKIVEQPKQSQVDQPFSEVSKQLIEDEGRQSENDVEFDDVAAHMDTSVCGNVPTSNKKCEQEPNESQVDHPILENSKQLEDEERQIQNNIDLDDVKAPMNKSVERNVLPSYRKCEQEPKQSQVDQPIPESCKQQMEEIERRSQNDVELDDIEAPMDTSVEGNVPTSYTKCEQESKQSDATKDSVNLQCKTLNKVVEEKPKKIMDVANDGATQKPRYNCRGRPRKNVEATKDVPSSSNLPVDQQEDLPDPETNEDSQQQIDPEKKKGRGRPPKHVKMAKNEAAVSSNLQLQQQAESEEPIEKLKKECRGRPRNKRQVNKEDSTVQLELTQKLEKEHRADPENSRSDAQGAVEGGQTRPPPDDNIKETVESQKLDSADQSDQKQNEQDCHEHEVKQGKLAATGYVRPPKEKSGKNPSIQVPLSSKDHLRSRIKHQSKIALESKRCEPE